MTDISPHICRGIKQQCAPKRLVFCNLDKLCRTGRIREAKVLRAFVLPVPLGQNAIRALTRLTAAVLACLSKSCATMELLLTWRITAFDQRDALMHGGRCTVAACGDDAAAVFYSLEKLPV